MTTTANPASTPAHHAVSVDTGGNGRPYVITCKCGAVASALQPLIAAGDYERHLFAAGNGEVETDRCSCDHCREAGTCFGCTSGVCP